MRAQTSADLTSMRKLRVNYLGYLDPFAYRGGAEMIFKMLLESGKRRGHDIRVSAKIWGLWSRISGIPRYNFHQKPDLWFLVDVWNCPGFKMPLDIKLIDRIIESEPYIHIDGAWVDICSDPYFSCKGDLNRCLKDCFKDRARRIHKHAIACGFMSPLHEKAARKAMGDDAIRKTFLIYPCIDTNLFRNLKRTRDIDYLYVGVISRYKGYFNIKERFRNREDFVFIGKNVTQEKLFGRHIEHIPQNKLVEYYNRAKNFVHLPEWIEPQGRGVTEAALCGCNLITNENVGATSLNIDLANPEIIKQSPARFWETIEGEV